MTATNLYTIIATTNLNNDSSIDFPTIFSSAYNSYIVYLMDIAISNGSPTLRMKVSTDGSTFDGSSKYENTSIFHRVSGITFGTLVSTGNSSVNISGAIMGQHQSSNSLSETIVFFNPLSSSNKKCGLNDTCVNARVLPGNPNEIYQQQQAWGYTSTSALTGFTLFLSNGALFTAGKVVVIGIGGTGNAATTLIDSKSANNSAASLDFPTAFSSSYNTYEIWITDLVASVNNATLNIRYSTDGSTFDAASGRYQMASFYNKSGSATLQTDREPSGTTLLSSATPHISSSAGDEYSGFLRIFNPSGAISSKLSQLSQVNIKGAQIEISNYMGHFYTPATALTGFQIYVDSGNIKSGKVTVIGIKN